VSHSTSSSGVGKLTECDVEEASAAVLAAMPGERPIKSAGLRTAQM
jgi:hypothetical protein